MEIKMLVNEDNKSKPELDWTISECRRDVTGKTALTDSLAGEVDPS